MKAQPPKRLDARTIAIWGPHGSSGKSTIAINLAESLSNSGSRVLLVDADLENPSLAIMLGLDRPVQDVSDVIEREPSSQPRADSRRISRGLLAQATTFTCYPAFRRPHNGVSWVSNRRST